MTEERRDAVRPVMWGVSRNVIVSGVVSFFMDVSSEMVYAIAPLFLESLGASKKVIGGIEGAAEGTAAIFKFLSGYLADRFRRYKPLVTVGYFLSAASRPVMALAGGWGQVFAARIFDRFGKGVRTAPRDAILAASVEKKSLGRAFGIHRAMDQAGAIVGPALAALVLWSAADRFPKLNGPEGPGLFSLVIWLSLVPGLLSVVATFFIMETGRREKAAARESAPAPTPTERDGARRYFYFLAVMFVFSIGNSSNAFLLLRARDLGLAVALVPLAYATMNAVYTAASVPWGVWADRVGFKPVILVGFAVFSVVYLAFGLAEASWTPWLLFAAYGLFESAFEGQSRAYLARIAKAHLRGTSFGAYHMLLALTVFPASLIAGFLWENVSHGAPFFYGAAMAGVAFVMLALEPVFLGREAE